MNDTTRANPCTCVNGPATSCTCGCQLAAAPAVTPAAPQAACACGPQCPCGPGCACPKF